MTLGPLEYVVIGLQDQRSITTLFPALEEIEANGSIRVADFVFVSKASDGTMTVQELGELSDEDLGASGAPADTQQGLLTAEDIESLATEVPTGASAVVVLLEHIWTIELTDAVSRVGGVLYAGGVVSPVALSQVRTELAEVAPAQ